MSAAKRVGQFANLLLRREIADQKLHAARAGSPTHLVSLRRRLWRGASHHHQGCSATSELDGCFEADSARRACDKYGFSGEDHHLTLNRLLVPVATLVSDP